MHSASTTPKKEGGRERRWRESVDVPPPTLGKLLVNITATTQPADFNLHSLTEADARMPEFDTVFQFEGDLLAVKYVIVDDQLGSEIDEDADPTAEVYAVVIDTYRRAPEGWRKINDADDAEYLWALAGEQAAQEALMDEAMRLCPLSGIIAEDPAARRRLLGS